MRITYHRGQEEPYNLLFGRDPDTQFYEQAAAKSALMLSPFDCERIGLDANEHTRWSEFGVSLIARDNGDFLHRSYDLSLERLRTFGSLLHYFVDTTDEELRRLASNNPPSKEPFAIRRVEARMVRAMAETIERRRIKVPRLWSAEANQVIGFTRPSVQ